MPEIRARYHTNFKFVFFYFSIMRSAKLALQLDAIDAVRGLRHRLQMRATRRNPTPSPDIFAVPCVLTIRHAPPVAECSAGRRAT